MLKSLKLPIRKVSSIWNSSLPKDLVKTHAFKPFDKDSEFYLQPYVLKNDDLSYLFEQLDTMIERQWPVSSLMIDRMVECFQVSEEFMFSEYYLYHFRHNKSGNFLRPWTVQNLVNKGLTVDTELFLDKQLDLLLKILENRPQYGLFPSNVSWNFIIDTLLNQSDSEEKLVSVARLIFTAEKISDNLTAVNVLKIALDHLSKQTESSFTEIDEILLRDLGGIIKVAGQKLKLYECMGLGRGILNFLEKKFLEENKFRKMYMQPFAPFSNVPRYVNAEEPTVIELNNNLATANKEFEKMLKEENGK